MFADSLRFRTQQASMHQGIGLNSLLKSRKITAENTKAKINTASTQLLEAAELHEIKKSYLANRLQLLRTSRQI